MLLLFWCIIILGRIQTLVSKCSHCTNIIPGQPSVTVTGKVSYHGLCSSDNYSMTTEWTGPYRGLCRVTGITATITLKTRIECEAGCNTARENWCCFGMINCGGDTMRRHCLDAYNTCVGKCPPSSYAGGTVVAKPYKSLDGGSDRSEFYLNSQFYWW